VVGIVCRFYALQTCSSSTSKSNGNFNLNININININDSNSNNQIITNNHSRTNCHISSYNIPQTKLRWDLLLLISFLGVKNRLIGHTPPQRLRVQL
jgi:hypothetical protein